MINFPPRKSIKIDYHLENSDKLEFLHRVYSRFNAIADKHVALFIACQFALESHFGRSHLAVSQFNFCGMRSPVFRITLNLNPAKPFATYADFDSCVVDYMLYLSYTRCNLTQLSTLVNFKHHLEVKGYCPDKDYLPSIQKLYDDFEVSFFDYLDTLNS